jgi:hypothetical protein
VGEDRELVCVAKVREFLKLKRKAGFLWLAESHPKQEAPNHVPAWVGLMFHFSCEADKCSNL